MNKATKRQRGAAVGSSALLGNAAILTRVRYHLEDLKRTGLNPRTMTDRELLKIRNLGKGTLKAIRQLTSQPAELCPHCGGYITPPNSVLIQNSEAKDKPADR